MTLLKLHARLLKLYMEIFCSNILDIYIKCCLMSFAAICYRECSVSLCICLNIRCISSNITVKGAILNHGCFNNSYIIQVVGSRLAEHKCYIGILSGKTLIHIDDEIMILSLGCKCRKILLAGYDCLHSVRLAVSHICIKTQLILTLNKRCKVSLCDDDRIYFGSSGRSYNLNLQFSFSLTFFCDFICYSYFCIFICCLNIPVTKTSIALIKCSVVYIVAIRSKTPLLNYF